MTETAAADRTEWFRQDHFGMFIHYGTYALIAKGEWVKSFEHLDDAEYVQLAEHFNPDLFDAQAIAKLAKDAGQRYAVLTAKHHEGFCLWDTATTDYNIAKTRGRDLVREYVEALRAEGLRVGLYFSLLDWHHPDYIVDWSHPLAVDGADLAAINAGRDPERFRAFMREQLRELLTGYGQIDYLFVDFTQPGPRRGMPGKTPEDWGAEELLAMCRELQPEMIVNDRFGLPADLVTPEQYQPVRPLEVDGERVLWEACQTINGSWGYDPSNLDDKSPRCWPACWGRRCRWAEICCSTSGRPRAVRSFPVMPTRCGRSANGCAAMATRSTGQVRRSSRRHREWSTPRTATACSPMSTPGRSRRCTCRVSPTRSPSLGCSPTA